MRFRKYNTKNETLGRSKSFVLSNAGFSCAPQEKGPNKVVFITFKDQNDNEYTFTGEEMERMQAYYNKAKEWATKQE